MAFFDTTRTAHGFDTAVSSFAYRIVKAVVDWNDARVTRKALSSLSNRELEDIGLARGDIDAVATSSFFR